MKPVASLLATFCVGAVAGVSALIGIVWWAEERSRYR
jgi:hypothetical protein